MRNVGLVRCSLAFRHCYGHASSDHSGVLYPLQGYCPDTCSFCMVINLTHAYIFSNIVAQTESHLWLALEQLIGYPHPRQAPAGVIAI